MLGLMLLAEAAKEETKKVDPKPIPPIGCQVTAEVLKHKAKRYKRWAEEIEDLLS